MSFVRVTLLWNMAMKPSKASSPSLWFLGCGMSPGNDFKSGECQPKDGFSSFDC